MATDDALLLTVVGDLVEDIVVWATTNRRGTDNPATVHRSRGGSGANVAAFAAPVMTTRFIGRVGADTAGDALAAELTRAGVDVRLQRDGSTGTVVVLVDETGERTMFPDRGAAAMLDEIEPAWLLGTTVMHLPAYGLLTASGASALRGAADEVRAHQGKVTVDLSAIAVVEQLGVNALAGLLVDLRPAVVFANREEAVAMGLLDHPPVAGCIFVVKDGPRPTTVVHPDRPDDVIPVEPVAGVRDTTGAGDAFAAGFLVTWLAGSDPAAATVAGHELAADTLLHPGAGTGER